MSSVFDFTVTSLFLGNVRIKPYFNTLCGEGGAKIRLLCAVNHLDAQKGNISFRVAFELLMASLSKFIMEKSHGEVSVMEQDKIENVF